MTIDRTKVVQSRAPASKLPKRKLAQAFCAVCRFNYPDVAQDRNLYHHECLDASKREYHAPPLRLSKEGQA